MNTPIVIFAFKRPWHLKQTLTALAKNYEAASSRIVIYCDGVCNQADQEAVESTRQVAKNCSKFAHAEVICRERNYGLSKSIITGVTEQLEINEKIIVLEDDMVTSPYFLQYMNEALALYADDERVISVHGYIYPVQSVLPETFFLRGADCWGWATWRRGWKYFNPNGKYLLNQLKKQRLISEFDFDGAYKFSKMLEDQISGRNDSWAIRWYASAFLENKLTLYPGHSLVQNIGNDSSGTHCGNTNEYEVCLSSEPLHVGNCLVESCESARSQIKYFLCKSQKKS